MVEIRFAQPDDREFWHGLDRHLTEEEFACKIKERRGYILLADGNRAGLLRYNLFWDNIPFCTMLYIDEGYQKRGYGRKLMTKWEQDMRERGFEMVLTSTRVDEEAQHFYRRLGYRDCGGLVIDVRGYEQPMELIMIKEL